MGVTKHLASGSDCPPLEPGKLRVYAMKFCPHSERTRLVISAKNIPHEEVNIRLDRKPQWYLDKYPAGLVPALELDSQFVPESLITCDLLEQLYPEPALYPSEPWQRARDCWFVDQFNLCISSIYTMLSSKGDPEKIREMSEQFNKGIAPFEAELVRRGTPFFYGDRPGMLDLMIWPWMERFPAIRKMGLTMLPTGDMPLPPPEIHNLHQWIMRMSEHPAVKKVAINTEGHIKYLSGFINGVQHHEIDT